MGSMTQLGTTTNSVSIPGVNIPTLPFAKAGAMTSLQQGGLFGIPDPLTFLAIIGLYVVQVTIILIYFTSRVQEGKNNLALKMELAQSLPLAMTFFFLAAFMGTQIASAAG